MTKDGKQATRKKKRLRKEGRKNEEGRLKKKDPTPFLNSRFLQHFLPAKLPASASRVIMLKLMSFISAAGKGRQCYVHFRAIITNLCQPRKPQELKRSVAFVAKVGFRSYRSSGSCCALRAQKCWV